MELVCCGDVDVNPGPEINYGNLSKVSVEHKQNLLLAHMNIQNVSKKRMQLKPFIDDMAENALVGISECW